MGGWVGNVRVWSYSMGTDLLVDIDIDIWGRGE